MITSPISFSVTVGITVFFIVMPYKELKMTASGVNQMRNRNVWELFPRHSLNCTPAAIGGEFPTYRPLPA
ncbi:hypothetical protein HMPREF1604_04640 [Escherichia coli 908519]|nr:hypothetical protein HMPREF1604_04640 [Escherichia coli 908519]